jgi:uncharacterized protein (TIGR02271 family)
MLRRLKDVPQLELAEGSPDVCGWKVVDKAHHMLGKVDSLIVDEDTKDAEGLTPIRYLGIQADGSVRMVPIGVTEINEGTHEIVLTRADMTDLDKLPAFQEEATAERDRGYFSRFFPEEKELNYRRPEFKHRSNVLQLIEERLSVGKREKQVGEAIARKRSETHPVEETVQLRREHVEVERHPVNKPLSETEYAQTGGRPLETDQEIRMPVMGEEAVIEKKPYVKEEVTLRKEATTETKTIRDQVRSEELEFVSAEPEGRQDLPEVDRTKEARKPEGLGEKIKRAFDTE